MSIPIEDAEEAQQAFGERLDVSIGFGKDSFYLAFGKDNAAVLKKVIDGSAAGSAEALPPSQMFVALAPVLKFAASVSDDEVTAVLARSVERISGNDRISITSAYVDRGVRSRIKLDEGVLQLIGESVMAFGAGAGAPAVP